MLTPWRLAIFSRLSPETTVTLPELERLAVGTLETEAVLGSRSSCPTRILSPVRLLALRKAWTLTP